jgi:subtilisin family serine protease
VPYQWYVYSGDPADIKLPQAWDLEHGSASTLIAILDTGVDTGHPDLASKIWTNPGEIAGNGIDDDHNGYIDDVKGWDFGDGDNDPNPGPMYEPDFGIDVGFHGTFCAGIAAAATNNVEGIAGAGWNCRIMPLKAADSSVGDLTLEAVSSGMTYAADMHASVLSMSLGAPEDPGVPEFFQALVDMCDAAGVLVVSAAGNDGTSARNYPAACNKVIAVAATDETNARASFSNWGSWVDVNAPGQDMWSSICRNYTIDDNSQIFYEFLWSWDGVNPYMYGDGTSFSTPLVAGVCGLIRSRWPFLTPQAAANVLVSRGDSVAFDHVIGRKVNAFKAVTAPVLAVAPAATAHGARLAGNTPNPFASETAIRLTTPTRGPAHLAIYDLSGRCVRRLLDVDALAPGTHDVRWDGRDAAGRRLGSGIYFAQLSGAEGTSQRRIVIAR